MPIAQINQETIKHQDPQDPEENHKKANSKLAGQQNSPNKVSIKEVMLAHIRTELWGGRYALAVQILATYKAKFGEDEGYLTEKARFLALTNQSSTALTVLEPLLKKHPHDPMLLDIKNYALTHPKHSSPQRLPLQALPAKKLYWQYMVLEPLLNNDPALLDIKNYALAWLAKPSPQGLPPLLTAETPQQPVDKNANEKRVMLESIRIQLWSGDYVTGRKMLAAYKEKFAEDEGYLTEKARFLALTNQSSAALTVLEPLLKKHPTSPMLLDIKNYALQTNKKSLKSQQANTQLSVTETAIKDPLLILADGQLAKAKYKKAAETYRKYLVKHPDDKEIMIEYIRATLWGSDYIASEKALAAYKDKFGKDEHYLTEKARFLALTNKSKEALNLIAILLKKYPDNKTLIDIRNYALKHRAIQQTNINQSARTTQLTLRKALALECATRSHRNCSMLAIEPNNSDAMLAMARSYSAQGKLDKAMQVYCRYTELYPWNEAAWIEYACVNSWCSDSRAALIILQDACKLFGKTPRYLTAKAQILAEADRPTASLRVLTPLLRNQPNDKNLIRTEILALYDNNQPIEMFKNLVKLNVLVEHDADIKDLNDFVHTPYRSNASLDIFYSKDTDTVDIDHQTLSGQIFITPLTQFLINTKEEELRANIGTGLEPIEGGTSLTISEETVGINYRINPKLALGASVGNAHVADGQDMFVYDATVNLKPTDSLLINLLESRYYYDVSARAVSLGVKQQLNQIQIDWEPYFQRYLGLKTYYSTFSDTNTMWYANFSPKLGVLRTEKLNLDFGLSGVWFGFSEQLNNGYYDPKLSQYYSVTADGYWKQSTQVGYSVSLAVGQQKDETFTSYKFGGDGAVRGYFGIYKDWMLVLSAAISNRGRAIAANSNANSNYKIWAFEATITRRF